MERRTADWEALYNQWRELFGLVMAFAETLPEEEDEVLGTRSLIFQNACIVAPKMVSASGDTLYQIKNGECCTHPLQFPANLGADNETNT